VVSSQIIQGNLRNATTKEMEKVGRAARQWVKYDATHLQQNFWFLGNNRDLSMLQPKWRAVRSIRVVVQVRAGLQSIDDGPPQASQKAPRRGGPVVSAQ
jgi:hypothetical protein